MAFDRTRSLEQKLVAISRRDARKGKVKVRLAAITTRRDDNRKGSK